MTFHRFASLLITFAVLLIPAVRAGADPVLRAIAEQGTPLPGTTGNLSGLPPTNPSISGRNIAFAASADAGGGIFAYMDGALRVIADTNTVIPGGTWTFGFPGAEGSGPAISARNVVFGGVHFPTTSIWVSMDGSLVKIAETQVTPVPGSTGTFKNFAMGNGASASISGGNIAFTGVGDETNGIYAYINGELRVIADTSTPVPGVTPQRTFMNFGQLGGVSPSISGTNVAFLGVWSDGGGLYAYINGSLRVIADTNTPAPAGTGSFQSFAGSPSLSGENVAFGGLIDVFGISGIYAYIDGSLRVIADTNTPVPGSPDVTFGDFGQLEGLSPVISGENVVFASKVPNGIFAYIDGSLHKIADETTVVPGRTVNFFAFGQTQGISPSISGENIVFVGVSLETNGIYLRTDEPAVPATSAWALAILAALLLSAGTAILRRRDRSRE